MSKWRLPYSDALDALDPAAIVESLAADAVIYVAVHDAPMEGPGAAQFLFGVLSEELDHLEVTEEIIEGSSATVLFEAAIRGQGAQGVNIVRLNDAGEVRELVVFFRPLATLGLIAEVVGGRMAEQFGPPPT